MENQTNSNQDCGCGDGCCPPPKKNSPLQRWIFIAIILAVVAIVAVRLVNKGESKENAPCCPQTECTDNVSCSSPSQSEEKASCCSKTEKK